MVIWGVDFKTKTMRRDGYFVDGALAILQQVTASSGDVFVDLGLAPCEHWPEAECAQYVAPEQDGA